MRAIAFYLPQFHRIPENDRWWGDGFTEWTNTRKAMPLFKGHRQPRRPAGDRFYDLTDPLARAWQADLARANGLHAFCYYHYWFAGRRLLETPFEQVLSSGSPEFPFCLCWANEPWSRAWSGGESDILMPQDYGGPDDWRGHYLCLRRAWDDPRHVRVEGKPVFLIYRAGSIPDCRKMLESWRDAARADGLGALYLIAMRTGFDNTPIEPHDQAGFDATVDFEPAYTLKHDLPDVARVKRNIRHLARRRVGPRLRKHRWLLDTYDYDRVWNRILRRHRPRIGADPRGVNIPGAFVDWDNTARKNIRAQIMTGVTPEAFGGAIDRLVRLVRNHPSTDLLFINAWNEWAEGCYLEPDDHHGDAFLQGLRRALVSGDARSCRDSI